MRRSLDVEDCLADSFRRHLQIGIRPPTFGDGRLAWSNAASSVNWLRGSPLSSYGDGHRAASPRWPAGCVCWLRSGIHQRQT